jgi:DNA-binding response OmpR family regulator
LQEQATTETIPIILLTAKVQPEDKAHFSRLGVTGMITKPFDPLTLSAEIAALLGWSIR